MDDLITNNLISAIKQKTGKEQNIVNVLMNILSLGKEAAYRRIRGEVPFTFEEVVRISQDLNLPLDNIVNKSVNENKHKWAVLDMEAMYSPDDYVMQYSRNLEMFSKIFQGLYNSQKAMLRVATNVLPYSLLLPYEKLSQFRFYKWAYLTQGSNPDMSFSKVLSQPNTLKYEKQLLEELQLTPRTLVVMNKDVFSSLINDINCFYQWKVISKEEFTQLKDELLDLIAAMEKLAMTGTHPTGTEITIYLCEIDITSTYVHVEYDDNELGFTWLYYIDPVLFQNATLCQKQKEWIESLKRYSIQITQSSERIRFDYFNKQRQTVREIMREE